MKKVRIKTEKEFLKEFGDEWRCKIDFSWVSPDMDYLHGKSISEFSGNGEHDCWTISQDTVMRRWAEGTWFKYKNAPPHERNTFQILKTSIDSNGNLEIECDDRLIINPQSRDDIEWYEEDPSEMYCKGLCVEDGMISQERIKKAVTEKDLEGSDKTLKWKPVSKDFDGKNFYDIDDVSNRLRKNIVREYDNLMMKRINTSSYLGGSRLPLYAWTPASEDFDINNLLDYKDMSPSLGLDPLFKKPHKVELKQKPKKERKLNLKFK